jgi:hypothetical protein
MEEFSQQFLPEENKYVTLEEVRALIANSMTGITSPLTVKSSYMQSADFVSGAKGWRFDSIGNLEANNGYFRGDITGATGTFTGTVNIGSLNIPSATNPDSMHVDTDGNSWWGCNVDDFASTNDNAKAYILKTGEAKFQDVILGSDSKYFKYDGTNAEATAVRYLEVFEAGEDITAGQPVCLGRGCYDHDLDEQIIAFRSAGVDSLNPDTNFNGASSYRVNATTTGVARTEWVLMDFDFELFSDIFNNCGGWFYTNSGTVNAAGPFTVDIYPITSVWDETTVTYNNLPTLGSVIASFSVNNADGSMYHTASLTDFMWKIKAGLTTAPYGFLLKGAQSNATVGYVNMFLETSANQEPGIRGRRMIYPDKLFRAKSSITEGDAQEYRCFNFIGIAAETATAGNDCKVQINGVANNLPGLIPGETYYIGDNIGTIDTASGLSANKPMFRIGRAVSTTSLIIEKGEKVIDWVFNTVASGYTYHPTYFRPVEIETWTGTDGNSMFPGRYINQRQYTVQNLSTSITTGYIYHNTDTLSIAYILPGGIVTTDIGAGNLCIGKIKG